MSIVLSIYSTKGFREIALPERGQNEVRILLDRELFDLRWDITLDFEKSERGWSFPQPGNGTIKRAETGTDGKVLLKPGMNLEIDTGGGRSVIVLAFEQTHPFSVYSKYDLTGLQCVSVGKGENNTVIYQNEFVSGEHCKVQLENGRATLIDNSTNGTYVNFRRVFGSTVLKYGDSIRIMRLNLIFLGNMLAVDERGGARVKLRQITDEKVNFLSTAGHGEDGAKALFHRSPRTLKKLITEPFEIEPPPPPAETQDPPLALMIGPALTMTVPMMLGSGLSIWASHSASTGSSAFMYMGIVTAISSAVIGAAWAIINLRHTQKLRRLAENRRFESYSDYLLRMRDKIERAYHGNSDALRERYPEAEACCRLNADSPLLWNRNVTHEDFMGIRLGIGDLPFQAQIAIPKERFTMIHDNLADKPELIRDNYSLLKEVPVTVDMLRHRLVGIAGGENRKNAITVAHAMIAQLAASNAYTDVKIAIVYDEGSAIDRDAWDFALWLPHVWSADKKIRYVATNRMEAGEVFFALTQILRNRSAEEESKRSLKPRFVLFVADPLLLDGEVISHYVFSSGADLGLTTVLLSARPEELPNECAYIIENDGQYQGIFNTNDGRDYGTLIRFDRVQEESLKAFAKNLGKIEVVESGEDGEIPSSLTFFDMYGINRPKELNVPDRWKKSNSIATMRALVGFRNGNAPCYLDINEKYHGPHGLVAGTTGSGKSETLQTYILSLAVNFSPEDIGFFIIDYKGGGMANLFDNLPHMIGSISNLSGNQVKRAMVSIQSENRRRQRVFTEYGVNNINGYTALYKNGDALEPIPHLFIIIDEFAELKREEPEFMKELISVAQVGRSLGVHLILSTQRPSGTVDENIWANSKFRLCLRVQDRQDSMDMLHRPEAAYLTQAGRCYLQVGNDEVFELFQSGWSGAPYDEETGGANLQIAQMLSATGKVDLAGNHARIKRKEELRRRWIRKLLEILHGVENETGVSASDPAFSAEENGTFLGRFYKGIREAQPDYESNQFNTARILSFCALYRDCVESVTGEDLADEIGRRAMREGKRIPEMKTRTQLEVTVDYLRDVTRELNIKEVKKLWLPVLPEYLYLEDLEGYSAVAFDGKAWQEHPKRFQLTAPIGLADDPANQAQFPVALDFTTGGNHMLTGTVATGKSVFLQTAIYSLASLYTPELLNIYCLDFSAKMLSVFADLKHVGGYMDESDLETDRINKFFTLIGRIMDERKKRFAGTGFEDYANHNGWTIPAILIAIDNYGSFHEKTGETYEPIMSRLVKEGNNVGIYLLVSAGGIGLAELPSRLAENFRTGLSLELPDAFAYADVLRTVKPPVLPESRVKGRGLLYVGETILEFQTALAARAEDGPERNELIKEAIARMNAAWTGAVARAIPQIPEKPTRADFTALPEYAQALSDPALLPVGYDYESADVYSFNLSSAFLYLVTGARQSGKTVFLENIIQTCFERGDEILIAEPSGSVLAPIAERLGVRRAFDGQTLYDMMSYLQTEMIARGGVKKELMERKASNEELFRAALSNRRICIFIPSLQAMVTELYNRESPAVGAMGLFEALCERGRGYNIFMFAEVGDREQSDLMGYACVESIVNCQSGIRFGGRFADQRMLRFENVPYQEQEKSMKAGIGVLPNENRDARQVRIVVPMS